MIRLWREICGHDYEGLVSSYYWQGQILERLSRDNDAINAYQQSLEVGQHHLGKQMDYIEKSQDRLKELRPIKRVKTD